jgi:hypothetical protein
MSLVINHIFVNVGLSECAQKRFDYHRKKGLRFLLSASKGLTNKNLAPFPSNQIAG